MISMSIISENMVVDKTIFGRHHDHLGEVRKESKPKVEVTFQREIVLLTQYPDLYR